MTMLIALSVGLCVGCCLLLYRCWQLTKQLRASNQRQELLFEKTGIGYFTWDIATDTVTAHRNVFQLYGDNSETGPVGADWFISRQYPEDAPLVAKTVSAAIEDGQPLNTEFRVVLPDGGTRWISCRGNVRFDQHGQLAGTIGLNLDITARKRAEAALRKAIEVAQTVNKDLNAGLEFAKVALWRWLTREQDTLSFAGPAREIFGKRPGELASFAQFEEIVHPEDRDEMRRLLASTLSLGIDFRYEYRIRVGDEIRWIVSRAGAIRDESEMICGITGLSLDITNAKLAEERLQQSEQRFRELADAMPQIVWTAAADGSVQYFNHQAYAFTGTDSIEGLKKCIHPDDFKRVSASWRRSVDEGVPLSCELRLRGSSDGVYRWHLSRAVPILDTAGKLCHWYGTTTDVDDYKRIQTEIQTLNTDLENRVEQRSAELAEMELRYRLLVEGIKDYAIFMIDTSGRITSWNQGAEDVMGYTTAEILGKSISKFSTREALAAGHPQQALHSSAEHGRHSEEGWRIRKSGVCFWASVVTTPLRDRAGNLVGFSKIIRDLTEQQRTMNLLVAERQNAERANQAKSNFLAAMSHEIRTPMNAILGMADLLSETQLDEMQREFVCRFQAAGSNLMSLINDLLDLSKIESGNFELETVPFDLEEVAQHTMELVAPRAHRKHLNLAFRMVPGLQPNRIGDPTRLHQILLNLLGNAIKFTEQGEIVLTIQPHSDRNPRHIQFEVSDTGIGIPADKFDFIFDDFVQAEASTTRRFGGTGLGLGIARRLVGLMGGSMQVQSELGVGSTFCFDAFLGQNEAAVPVKERVILEDLAQRRILIVESNRTNQRIYREMCAVWTMRPEVTNSARTALTLLSEAKQDRQPFAILMLDRFSSDLNAFEALEQIRAICPEMPVILTAAEDHPGEATRATNYGFGGYLVKPIRRSTLLRLISSKLVRTSPQPALAPAAKLKLLVADDSEDNRYLIEAYLAGSRYEAAFVENGDLAVEQFNLQAFDLVLMDMQMPVLDGLEATAAIRALEKNVGRTAVPIIALTGHSTLEDIDKSKQAGCNAHLAKPISKTELLRVLSECSPIGV